MVLEYVPMVVHVYKPQKQLEIQALRYQRYVLEYGIHVYRIGTIFGTYTYTMVLEYVLEYLVPGTWVLVFQSMDTGSKSSLR